MTLSPTLSWVNEVAGELHSASAAQAEGGPGGLASPAASVAASAHSDGQLRSQAEDLAAFEEEVDKAVRAHKAEKDVADPRPAPSPAAASLHTAIAKGAVNPREAAGLQFARATKGDKSLERDYAACRTTVEKAEFRLKWARTRFAALQETKSLTEAFRRVDLSKGVYKPPVKILEAEGADAEGLKATKKIIEKCLSMGPPWTRWNAMSERREYLHMEVSSSEIFENCWMLFKTGDVKATATVPDTVDAEGAFHASPPKRLPSAKGEDKGDAEGVDTVPSNKKRRLEANGDNPGAPTSKAKGEDKGEGKSTGADKDTGKEEVRELRALVAKACRVKAKYHQEMGKVQDMLTAIEKDPRWAWAKGALPQKEMVKARDAVTEACTPWMGEFFAAPDAKGVRAAELSLEAKCHLQKLVGEFSETLAKLATCVHSAHRMNAIYHTRDRA